MFREQPIRRLQLGALEQARQYATADAYAADNNPFGVMNTDPQHLKDRSEREYEKLVAQWNHWKNLGLLSTAVVEFHHHPEQQATQSHAASWQRQRAASEPPHDSPDKAECIIIPWPVAKK
jgi:hypothetical protein